MMQDNAKRIRHAFVFVLVILFLSYVLFQSKNLLEGPIISITKPSNGETLTYHVVSVEGTAKNISFIYMNDRQIFVDTLGNFRETIIAPLGYSIIKLSAKDKFGRKTERYLHVVLPGTTTLPSFESIPKTLLEPTSSTSASTTKNI